MAKVKAKTKVSRKSLEAAQSWEALKSSVCISSISQTSEANALNYCTQ